MNNKYDIHWLLQKFESGETLKYIFFWGHTNAHKESTGKFCLSQWFESPFTVANTLYKTAEHWMMAQKALLFGNRNIFNKIIECNKPGEAKELGRQIAEYDENIWNARKFEIVRTGNIHKFNQHPHLADYLLKTENRILAEASPLDTIWGIGLSQNSLDLEHISSWKGLNLLGFALMEARDFLKEFGHFSPLENPVPPPWHIFTEKGPHVKFSDSGIETKQILASRKYFQSLNEKEKTIFQLTYLTPDEWTRSN